jgi:hypothetical protein
MNAIAIRSTAEGSPESDGHGTAPTASRDRKASPQ